MILCERSSTSSLRVATARCTSPLAFSYSPLFTFFSFLLVDKERSKAREAYTSSIRISGKQSWNHQQQNHTWLRRNSKRYHNQHHSLRHALSCKSQNLFMCICLPHFLIIPFSFSLHNKTSNASSISSLLNQTTKIILPFIRLFAFL
jgi:hypothetical protein